MKASPEQQRLLLEVVDLDARITRAQHARNEPPEAPRISELVAQRQEYTRDLTQLIGVLEDARTELSRIESDVQLVEQRKARDNERLVTTSNPKDAQALENELENLARRQSDLEDMQLEVMARVEDAEAAVAAQQALIDEITSEGTALSTRAKAGIAAATAEEESLRAQRAEVVGGIPEDLLADYERRAARGVGAGLLRRGTCEGCQMVLSASDLSKIRQTAADDVVYCPECSGILVRTEESGL